MDNSRNKDAISLTHITTITMRRNLYTFLLLSVVLFSLHSCGVVVQNKLKPQPFTPPLAKTVYELDMPFEQAWDGAVDFFAVNNLKIETIDKSSGLISSPSTIGGYSSSYWTVNDGLINPKAWIAVQYSDDLKKDGTGMRTTARWNIRIKPTEDGKSRLYVNLSKPVVELNLVTYRDNLYGITRLDWVTVDLEATSTGRFEKMMYNYIITPDKASNVENRRPALDM